MPEVPMHEELLNALNASGLCEAGFAGLLLRDEGRVDVNQSEISCAELLKTYKVRLSHVRSIPSAHAHRLAEAISEFVSNLDRCPSETGRWITVKGNGEPYFLIFCLEEGPLLGCLPVVSKLDVSSERWAELWSDNA